MWLNIIIYIIIAILSIFFVIVAIAASSGFSFKLTAKKCVSKKLLEGKTVLVTGGTAGIGLATAEDLARRGAKVIIACPFEQEGTNAQSHLVKTTGNKNIEFKLLNLASLSSVREFAEDILKSETRLDILVNNAGVMQPDLLTVDCFNFVMHVNYIGLVLLTVLLLPLLKRTGSISDKSRIINLSSMLYVKGTVDIDSLSKAGYYSLPGKVYFNSKLCVVLFTRELSTKLGNSNVVVHAADPRAVATQIASGYNGFMRIMRNFIAPFYPTAMDGAQSSLHAALDEEAGQVSGEYFYNCRRKQIAPVACDEHTSRLLWDETLKLLNFSKDEIDKINK